ncbi:MAG: response regulator [Vicinamibacterales bacterium]
MSDPDGASPVGRALKVLIVDDNADGVATLAMLLELTGYDVRTASDGEAALVAAESFRPDAIVLDIGLPVLDGYEVARRIRASSSLGGTTLIALTGYGQDGDRSHRAGFDHYFVKPTDPRVLFDVLGQCAADRARARAVEL